MRSSAVILPFLASLAVATPVIKREAQGTQNIPSWVCEYFPSASFCNGSSGSASNTSSGSTTVTETSSGTGTGTGTGGSANTTPSPSSTPSSSGSSSGTSSSSGNEWVTQHNTRRQKHVDTADVAWDETLAQGATEHSQKCVFEHSQGGDYGENLAMGSGLTAQQTLDMWYGEIDQYGSYWGKNDVPMDVMHFTQVVWKQTTKVGCGVAECSQGRLITCRYSPAGNVLGTFAENVGELK